MLTTASREQWAVETREAHRRRSAWEPWARDAGYNEDGEDLAQVVADAEKEVETARAAVEEAEGDVTEAEDKLDSAESDLTDAKKRLEEAKEELGDNPPAEPGPRLFPA